MEEITQAEITEWLKRYSFARPRDVKPERGQEPVTPFGESTVITQNINESVNLLRSGYGRLETVQGNLQTAINIVEEFLAVEDPTEEEMDAAYAKLRSLAAGIDVVIDNSRFNGERVFDGSDVFLAGDAGGRSQKLEVENMLTFGDDDGLGLVNMVEDAKVDIFYTENTVLLNNLTDLVGLDITGGSYVAPEEGAEELENGEYRVRITYMGENSTVELTDGALEPIVTLEDVDLSGSGFETVDFGNGLALTFEKEDFGGAFGYDKYDFENLGPTRLYADIGYLRLDRQELINTSALNDTKLASLVSNETLSIDGGALTFSGASVTDAGKETDDNGDPVLADGEYSMRVNYFGSNSNIWLRDSDGRLVDLQSNIDLSGTGDKEITFDNGLKITLNANDMPSKTGVLEATVNVQTIEAGTKVYEPELTESSVATSTTGTLEVTEMGVGSLASADEQLEEGTYQMEIRYFGAASNAILRNADGEFMDIVTGLDLSSEGESVIDFGKGINFTLNNDNFGSESGTVTVDFKVVGKDPVAEINEADFAAGVTFNSSDTLDDGVGTLSITSAALSDVDTDVDELQNGDYSVKVSYFGKNSMVWLYDSDGRRIDVLTQVDLSEEGENTIDFGNGASITISNDGGYADTSTEFEASFTYQREQNAVSNGFDFDGYLDRLEEAKLVVEDQMLLVDDTFVAINARKVYIDAVNPNSGSFIGSTPGTNAIQLLATNVDANSVGIFQPSGFSQQINSSIMQIIASAGSENQPQVSTADLISSASGGAAGSSIFGLL